MFSHLRKILPLLSFPPGLAVVLLLIVLGLWGRKPRAAKVLLVVAMVVLYGFSTEASADALQEPLERSYPEVRPAEAPKADAIVVLGGGLHTPTEEHHSVELTEASDRVWMGAELYRAGKAPWVLVTGGNLPMYGRTAVTEAEVAKELLEAWGVPAGAILVEGQSQSTRENATMSKPVLAAKAARRVLLVTSAQHMPRSVGTFRKEGIDVIPVPTDYEAGWHKGDLLYRLLPSPEALWRSEQAMHEWAGWLVYRVRGWA